MLCDTCRNYPRHIEEFEGLREISLSLSCPEAARILLSQKEKVHFVTIEKEAAEETYDDFDYFLFTALMDTRDLLIKIIQNRNVPIRKRLWKVLAITHDFQLCLNKNELFKWEEIRKRHEDSGFGKTFCDKVHSRMNTSDTSKDLFKNMWKTIIPEMEVLRPGWKEFLKERLDSLYISSGENDYIYQKSEFDFYCPDWQIQEEQLLVYWIYTYFCGAVYDDEIFTKVKMAVVCTLFIHELDVGTYLKNEHHFNLNDQIQICYQFSRELEHSDLNLNKFQELCPQADKNIKYAKDTFLMMLSIARNNIYSEKFSNDDGEIIFFVTTKKLAERLGKCYSQNKIDKVGKYIKMLVYHDLIRILDDDQIPKELLYKAIKCAGTDTRAGKHVNFYAIPSWVVQQLKTIEDNGIRWKDKGYRIGGVSFDMFYRSEGFEVAASLYPQYKKKKNEYGEIVNRTTTKASDERTLKISEVILHCIQRKGYCTEKEVVYILGNEYRYEVTDTQTKRCLNEIMDCYGLKKVKANKALKEQFDIKLDGYPYIIIEDEI